MTTMKDFIFWGGLILLVGRSVYKFCSQGPREYFGLVPVSRAEARSEMFKTIIAILALFYLLVTVVPTKQFQDNLRFIRDDFAKTVEEDKQRRMNNE